MGDWSFDMSKAPRGSYEVRAAEGWLTGVAS